MILWCGHHTARSCAVLSLFILCSLFPATPVLANQCDDLRVQALGWWEWVSTTGGWGGPVTTPATEGYTLDFEFRSDGTYDLYRNGILHLAGPWQVDTQIDILTGDFRGCWTTVFSGSFQIFQGRLYFESDMMVWDHSSADAETVRFQRRDPVSTESISWGMLKAERAGN